MVKHMWILENGKLDMDKSILVSGKGMGKVERVPVYSVLLETDQGLVLIDTGLNPDGLENPEKAWGERAKTVKPILRAEDDVRCRLKEIGVSVNDVKYVINTHLHWDHTGGNRFFNKSTILVQKAEYRFALWPDNHLSGSYMENHFDVKVHYQLVEGDYELMPGVMVFQTPGHTPGHQSVLVTMQNQRKIIIAGDAVYTWENLNDMCPPGNGWSHLQAINSLNRIKSIMNLTQAIVLPAHDPGFWDKIKHLTLGES